MASKLGPGKKSLERGSTFKVPRAAMQRKRRPSRKSGGKVDVEFLARYMQRCAVCGTKWSWPDPHHVVEQQELKSRGLRHLLDDGRNIMWLCPIFLSSYTGRGEQCHERHTNASRRIPYSKLTPANLGFAREVLGDGADSYLDRRYPGRPQRPNSSERL